MLYHTVVTVTSESTGRTASEVRSLSGALLGTFTYETDALTRAASLDQARLMALGLEPVFNTTPKE